MKKIVLAGAVIAALLSACGGNGSATHIPNAPQLSSAELPRLAATLTAFPATSALRLDAANGDYQPMPANPLDLVIENGEAKVCQLKASELVCGRPARTGNWRGYEMCKQAANARMYACFDTADRLTNFGQHPAP